MSGVPQELYQPIALILVSILSIAFTIIGYFLKDIRSTMNTELVSNKREIQEVKDDLADFKAVLPHNYVMREDFIRAVSGLDHKVDSIGREITEINKNIGKLLGGG
ncbi:hypothetical protein JCM15765_02470 [Paradesulfitobacterium aromaticivorans]